jgi:phage terminase small subunit
MSRKVDESGLTDAQKLFCLTYLKNRKNGTRAYKELHPEVSNEVAAVKASELVRNGRVAAYLKAESEKVFKGLNISIEQTHRETAQMAYMRLLKDAQHISKKDVQMVKALGSIKVSALRELAEQQGLHDPETVVNIEQGDTFNGPTLVLPPEKPLP